MMHRFVLETAVARAPDEVFDYLAAVERMAEWQIGVEVERLDDGPDGPDGVGNRWRKTRTTPMGRQSLLLERTAYDPATRSHELAVVGGVADGSSERWSVEPSGTGSIVRLDAPTYWRGPLRLLGPVINRMVDRQLRAELARLSEMLEGRRLPE